MDFKKADPPVPYFLGIRELASNSAITDVGGLSCTCVIPSETNSAANAPQRVNGKSSLTISRKLAGVTATCQR